MTRRVSSPPQAAPLLLALAAFLLLPLTVLATEVPFLAGRVNDNAGLLSPGAVQSLEAQLKEHEDSTSNQVVVLTVSSLEGESIEEYSIRVVDTWKLGQKGKDNGVLLLVAKEDRKVRIEVGRGLEGDLTDALCSQIIRKEIIPRFKGGDYERGVQAGVEAILGAIAGSYTADEEDADEFEGTAAGFMVFLFFLFVVGIFTMIAFATQGCAGWFLYAFLLPFWGAFPTVTLGSPVGPALFVLYAVGMPLAKMLLPKSTWGKNLIKKVGPMMASSSGGRGGWSSGSSGSSGSSFSGGGGSFSGGGSSGSW